MEPWLIATLLILLVTANGAPLLARLLMGKHWNWPLDCNIHFADQRPLLGTTKTLRGLVAAIAATALVAQLLGLTWIEGACFGFLAMLGDLCSSFIKRRLGFHSSRPAPLLDQLPESVLPVWLMQPVLEPTVTEMLAAVLAFIAIDLLSSLLRKPENRR